MMTIPQRRTRTSTSSVDETFFATKRFSGVFASSALCFRGNVVFFACSSCLRVFVVAFRQSHFVGQHPVVKLQLHSAGDASPLTVLLLPHIFPICSVVAP